MANGTTQYPIKCDSYFCAMPKVPGDDLKPSLSRRGHQKLLNMAKANLAVKKALYQALCSDPEPPSSCPRTLQEALERAKIDAAQSPLPLVMPGLPWLPLPIPVPAI